MKYCEIYQNVTQTQEVSKCFWKNSAARLARCRVATNLQFVKKLEMSAKHNKVKHNKGRYTFMDTHKNREQQRW